MPMLSAKAVWVMPCAFISCSKALSTVLSRQAFRSASLDALPPLLLDALGGVEEGLRQRVAVVATAASADVTATGRIEPAGEPVFAQGGFESFNLLLSHCF